MPLPNLPPPVNTPLNITHQVWVPETASKYKQTAYLMFTRNTASRQKTTDFNPLRHYVMVVRGWATRVGIRLVHGTLVHTPSVFAILLSPERRFMVLHTAEIVCKILTFLHFHRNRDRLTRVAAVVVRWEFL